MPVGSWRVGLVVVGAMLAAMVIVAVVRGWGEFAIVPGALLVGGAGYAWLQNRRRADLDDVQLVARGRFTQRRVKLADLRQVGAGVGGVWIRTWHPVDARGGTWLYLRMIRLLSANGPPALEAVQIIRARAEAAGARLDPPLPADRLERPRSDKPLIFSI